MNAAQLLRLQYDGIHSVLVEALDRVSAKEWRTRSHPGTNVTGFTAWHVARTQDWALNTLADAAAAAERVSPDAVPSAEANQSRRADYLDAAMRPEVVDLFGMPAWRFATGPANGHARLHLGELRAGLEAVRRGRAAPAL